MSKGYQMQSDHVTRSEYQCKFCGGWINKIGFVDDAHRTSRATYCVNCNTSEQRKLAAAEQQKIEKERRGGK